MFGNEQHILSKYVDALLILQSVTSYHDLKELCHLYDSVESHVRVLRALTVDAASYGQLSSSIPMIKLPTEMHLIISRELDGGKWNVEEIIRIMNCEIKPSTTCNHIQKHSMKGTPPTYSLFFNHSGQSSDCVYCGQAHLYQAHAMW